MKVTTPVKGFTGEVAGVTFVDGKGETEDPSALAYFRRQGYGLAAEEDPADAKSGDEGKPNEGSEETSEKPAEKATPRRGRQPASK